MSENKRIKIDHPGTAGDGSGAPNHGEHGSSSKRIAETEADGDFEGQAPEGGPGGYTPDLDRDEGGDLLSHFVRRTDNSYAGIEDKSLLGDDIGDDEVDEDGEPI